MKLKTFYDNFELMADAPNGVQKLREMILQLAVQGELVPQDPKDEPASVLLEKIRAVKERLVSKSKNKMTKPQSPIKDDEIPYELPANWEWVRLGEFFDVRDGTHDTPKYVSKGFPLITSKNISNGKLDFSNIKYISAEDHKKIKQRSVVGRLDILFAMIGSIGNPVIVDTNEEFSIKNVALFKYYSIDLSCPDYLLIFLKNASGKIKQKSSGAVQSFVSLKFLRNYLFPIPPFAEQKRIVAKVDELMALCDELEARKQKASMNCIKLNDASVHELLTAHEPKKFNKHWQRICDNFDLLYSKSENVNNLRQAILQLAVQGKLVPHDPKDEPASVLLEKIRAEKELLIKEGKIKKTKPLPQIKPGEIPYELPNGWEWVRLRTVCHDWGQKKPDKKFTYIDVTSINKEKGVVSNEVKLLAAEGAPSRARKIVRKGSVIYSTVRPYLLNIAIIDQHFDPEPIVSTAFFVLNPFAGIDNLFIYHYLRSKPFIEYVEDAMTGMAYPAINDSKMSLGLAPIPPSNEQKRIVAKVDELMALCDELEASLSKSQKNCDRLMEAAVAEIMAA